MNKYQEKIFKSYIQTIECWTRDLADEWNNWDENKPSTIIIQMEKDLIKVRVNFLKWFGKQCK